MIDEKLENLLSVLGYTERFGVKYYPFDTLSALSSLSPLSRIISRINDDNEEAQIHGTYVIKSVSTGNESDTFNKEDNKSNTLRPVVFVAKANTVQEAREIHRSLWNSSSAPFVIVRLPDQIKIYTGFDYDKNNENHGLLDEIDVEQIGLFDDFSTVTIEALQKYSAEAIDDGSIWQKLRNAPQEQFNYDNRVDKRLLKNLEDLEEKLLEKLSNLERTDTLKYIHAIIGKFVYLRYLYDRKILTENWAKKKEINLDKVLRRGATLSELIKITDAIEDRFGGKIFPFPEGFKEVFDDSIVDYVASVFCGDTAYGQAVLFDVYDFSYIPTETLSYIYEQFLKAQGLSKKHGAVYTPEALADYLVNEASTIKPLRRGMKILDPCCGSGIFLVLTYRYLIELELQNRQDKNLKPNELKQIMEESIHGIEINLEACYVTEFSLILILLNYVEPPDLDKYDEFKFPNLHNQNIFEGDFFDSSREFYPLTMSFDWVIGNPPWKTIDIKDNPEDKNALVWVKANSKIRPVGNNRIEEAFAWRATEFVNENGCVGFVLPAQPLFNAQDKKFRKYFFRQNEVRRISNFSNFHYLLFQADVSAITIIYQKSVSEIEKRPIWHYSPFVANQIIAQLRKGEPARPVWAIVINKNEIKMIAPKDAETGDAITWKLAFWGNYEHERAFLRLQNTYSETFGAVVKRRGWAFHEGLRLRTENEDGKPTEPLDATLFEKFGDDLKYFLGKIFVKTSYRFNIPQSALKEIPRGKRNIVKGARSGLSLISAPHLILNAQYAVYSDEDFVIKNLYGVSSPQTEDAAYLKAISIYFNSSICEYLLFFLSPQLGIHRGKLNKKDWEKLPLPSFSESQVKQLADLHTELCRAELESNSKANLQGILDSEMEIILELPDSVNLLVKDFLTINKTLNKTKKVGKTNPKIIAVRNPKESELQKYAKRLRDELDGFVEGEEEKHLVTIIHSDDLIVCQVNLLETQETQDFKIEKSVGKWNETLTNIKKGIQERFSQWIYIQRELRFFDTTGNAFYICKSSRLIDWTESQAISDANDLFGETLAKTDLNLDSFIQSANYGNSTTHRIEKN